MTAPPLRLPAAPGSAALEALLAKSDEMHVLSDRVGCFLWGNGAFTRHFGSPAKAGAAWLNCFGAEAQDPAASLALQQGIADGLAQGRLVPTVVVLRGRTGSQGGDQHPVLSLQISGSGELRLWTMTDLSEQRRLQGRLQRMEELLETAQEFGRLGVWERDILSGKGRWDKHVFRFWGLDPADGTPDFDVAMQRIHPDDRNAQDFALSTRRAGRYSQRFRVMLADGSLRWLHSHWEIKASPSGKPTHAVGVMVDDTDVIATARSLSEASAKLSLAAELGEIIVFQQDLLGDRIFFNARGFELLGLPNDETGVPMDLIRQMIHPDDQEEAAAAPELAMTRPGPVNMQYRYRRPDGQWRNILSRLVMQRDALGRPLAFVGVALDMTERVDKQREEAELARRLEVATTAAGVGIWSRDTQTEQAHWNAQMYRMCGWPPELGPPSREQWIDEIIHPLDRATMRSARPELMASPSGSVEHEYRIVLPDGTTHWLVNRVRREEWNGRTMIFGATIDITQRRIAEQALRNANERIALATRGAGIATWEFDLNAKHVRWDQQMYALRGLPLPDDLESGLSHQFLKSLAHPDERPQIKAAHKRSLTEGSMASYEFRVRWPDGSYRWLASRSIPIYDDNGTAVRQIGVNWDVHERVMAEEVRRKAQAAQRQSEAKSELLARMSHELRTPLNAILGFAQLLEIEATPQQITQSRETITKTQTSRDQMLGHIRNAAEHLLEVVDEVLDISTIETTEAQMALQTIELAQLLRRTVESIATGKQAKAVALRLHGRPITVRTDPARLRQILTRLLAHQLTSLGTRANIEVATQVDANDARISIIDRTPVPSPASQFDLFDSPAEGGRQRRPSRDMAPDLGLFNALLAGMGGRIESTGGGEADSSIVITLPLASPAPSNMPPALEAETAPQARVLYIEDNPVNVILVEQLIAKRGHIDFSSEATGLAGVARAAAIRPDLVLIDIHLPDIDGFEVLRRLRANPATRSIQCVALSANAIAEDVARARSAGFDDYWTKPIRFSSFLAGLDRLLPETRPS